METQAIIIIISTVKQIYLVLDFFWIVLAYSNYYCAFIVFL